MTAAANMNTPNLGRNVVNDDDRHTAPKCTLAVAIYLAIIGENLRVIWLDQTEMGRLQNGAPPTEADPVAARQQQQLPRQLAAQGVLFIVNFAHCHLGDAELQRVLVALSGSPLQLLDLSNNFITAVGLNYLSGFLSQSDGARVRSINLANNRVAGGGEELAKFTPFVAPPVVDSDDAATSRPHRPRVLEFLSLSGNPLGHDGVMLIANAILLARGDMAMSAVRVLDLARTGMSVEAADKLSLAQNLTPSLVFLDIRFNPLPPNNQASQLVKFINRERFTALIALNDDDA